MPPPWTQNLKEIFLKRMPGASSECAVYVHGGLKNFMFQFMFNFKDVSDSLLF